MNQQTRGTRRRNLRAPSLMDDLRDPRSSAQRLADARREFIEAHDLEGDAAEIAFDAVAYGFYAAPVAKMYTEEEEGGMIVGEDGEGIGCTATQPETSIGTKRGDEHGAD